MIISRDQVVLIQYTLRDDEGTILDQSEADLPLPYLHGHGNIIPGLEEALEGLKVGDEKSVIVPPEKGYGERDEDMILTVPRDQMPEDLEPEVGMELGMETDEGVHIPVRITAVSDTEVEVDANSDLAGMTLHYEVKVVEIRPATAEELAHGHVHGEHDHEHC